MVPFFIGTVVTSPPAEVWGVVGAAPSVRLRHRCVPVSRPPPNVTTPRPFYLVGGWLTTFSLARACWTVLTIRGNGLFSTPQVFALSFFFAVLSEHIALRIQCFFFFHIGFFFWLGLSYLAPALSFTHSVGVCDRFLQPVYGRFECRPALCPSPGFCLSFSNPCQDRDCEFSPRSRQVRLSSVPVARPPLL